MAETPCPVCGGPTVAFLDGPEMPAHSVTLHFDADAARAEPGGEMRLRRCGACGHVVNAAYDPSLHRYGADYESTQRHSAVFSAFDAALARRLVDELGLAGGRAVEIGCGQGEFLVALRAAGMAGGTGFDPAHDPQRSPAAGDPAITIHPVAFDARTDLPAADLLVCKMTLEHIARPRPLLRALRGGGAATGAPLFLQVPDAGRIWRIGAFEDIYYEHCQYFTAASLARLLAETGFAPERLDSVYDGQYLAAVARPAGGTAGVPAPAAGGDVAGRIAARVRSWRERLTAGPGPVLLWGGGSKAVAFLAWTGVAAGISSVVDINPLKRGSRLPGSGLPVLAPADAADLSPARIVVMNPVYRDEVRERCATLGLEAELLALDG
jgi:hypothetical protein